MKMHLKSVSSLISLSPYVSCRAAPHGSVMSLGFKTLSRGKWLAYFKNTYTPIPLELIDSHAESRSLNL